jgi:CRP-like cAMP-binding protein
MSAALLSLPTTRTKLVTLVVARRAVVSCTTKPHAKKLALNRLTTSSRLSQRWSSNTTSSKTATESVTAKTSTTTTKSATSSSLKRKLLGEEAIIPCHRILPLSVKNSPRIVAALPWLGNVAYIGIASGFLMTDMLQLRVLLVGGYTGLVIYHILRPVPLRIPLRWSAVFVLVNASAAALLVADRYWHYWNPLTDEERQLYNDHFSALTPGQFTQLMSLVSRQELEDQQVLTVEGVPCPNLYFIEHGKVIVYHHKAYTATITQGGFVNDVAFQRSNGGNGSRSENKNSNNVGAYGTVMASGPCSVLVWDQATLQKHLERRPQMHRNLKFILSDHLVKSLLRQREAAHLRQRRWEMEHNNNKDNNSNDGNKAKEDLEEVAAAALKGANILRSPSQQRIRW